MTSDVDRDDGAQAIRVASPLRKWLRRQLADPQTVFLATLLVAGLLAVVLLGRILAPVITAVVIAYILDAPTTAMRRRGVPHRLAVSMVFVSFLALIALALVTLVPLLSRQLTQLAVLLPRMITGVQELLLELPEHYPELVNREQVFELSARLRSELLVVGQNLLVFSLDSIGSLFSVGIYLFLVPLMVFFLLKDKDAILGWIKRLLPRQHGLAQQVWIEVDLKIGAYLRGKIYEVFIVGSISYLAFALLDLDFALLLAVLSGLSVLVPLVGVVVVAFPIALVALFQFGATGSLAAVCAAYVVIQTIDGNVLAPLLISEVVDLHPIAIVVSILFFGGIWGLWGIFFAIPLATLAVAVLNAWPRGAAEELPAR